MIKIVKKGDIVVCIDNKAYPNNYSYPLTIGKKYIIDIDNYIYCYVTNDNGAKDYYSRVCFKLLSDIRDEQLGKLGI